MAMRVYTSEVKDDKTHFARVLSDCSFNMAMDWLENTLAKYGVKIGQIRKTDNGLFSITTTKKLQLCRTYYYDEARGLLLGE